VTYPVVCGLLGAALGLVAASAAAQSVIPSDQDHPAPFNYGYGPGVRVPGAQVSVWNRLLGRGQTPVQTEQAIAGLAHQLVAPPSQGTAACGEPGDVWLRAAMADHSAAYGAAAGWAGDDLWHR
jgi:hypothetical protein